MKPIVFLILFFVTTMLVQAQTKVLKQGHRGCRGLMPENTIAAMKKAIDLGADVLELDVTISKDGQVVVSHDPYLSAAITLKPSGDSIRVDEQKTYTLYTMTYAQMKKFDVGSKHHVEFPRQQNFPAYVPLLSELVDSADAHARQTGKPLPFYNIEIKSNPKTDGVNHPEPEAFVNLVMGVCKRRNLLQRMNIQSFDVRPLQVIHQKYPEVILAYLTANPKTVAENFSDLGFMPARYSPHYKTVTAQAVQYCHEKGIKIIPWTVNTKAEIDALIALNVDGIITDYPDLF